MKRISILFLAVLLFKLSQAQVSQFPQIYYSGQVGGNSLIRANASLSASTLTTLRGNYNIGAESITSSTESYGTATWAKVCLPSTSSTNNTPNYGYTMYGSYYIRISENNNYAKVNTINDALGVRTCAGCISSRVTIGGQNAYYGKNSILALTGNISSGWYEIYLTNNCSQTTGWVDGQYLTFPSSQSYKIIGGSVTNSPNSAFVWGASINFSGLTSVNTTEGFFQYKVPANWSGTLTCSHPSYNTSSPTSISIFANNHYYTNNFVLSNVTPCTGVTITTPPQSQTKTVGNTATFSVVAGGTSPYTYQWKKNGTNISGATSSSYTTPTLTLSDNGNTYSCYLTNCSGNNNTTSNSATLSVTNNCTAVSITTHPQNQSKTVGNTATFSVVAGGISPYTYQWKKNGTNISGATSSSYTTPTLTLSDNGNTYSCYLTNCSGVNNVTSNNATLSVSNSCTSVSITTQPQNQSKTVGNTATFSVVAGGTSPYTYQWRKNGTNISGATSSTYVTPTLTLSDNGNTYSCYLTNCSGVNNVTSYNATLSVSNSCTSVSITTQPQNQSKTVGNTATFSVVAGGTSPYTYQWRKNGTNISGATSSTYVTPTLTLSDNGNTYSCYLTNCSGVNNVTSYNATLSVSNSCTSVSITTQPQNQSKTVGNTATFSVVAGGTSPYTYQWRKNGTNISGATSSTYVTPTLTLSDNGNTYSCYLTNCSGGNNTTSSSGTLTVTNNTPSQVILNNIIKNNTRFTNPKLLWSGYTNQTPDIIKICADASNATEITFVNNTGINSNNIRFLIASDPLGNDSEKSGYFIRNSENLSINGNIIKNKLTHPKYLEPQYKPSRIDTIIVVDVNNVNVRLFSIPIQIYRSPVVLVHGFTGGSDYIGDESFNVTKDYLVGTGNYLWNFIRVANYHTTSYQAFEVNQYVVPNNINNIFNEMRFNKISCGKVDVVGFSMGGCLSRIYLQTDACAEKEDIHKLITINTPHFGSQWGNLFSNPLTKPVVWPLIAAKIRLDLGNVNIEENLGAVYDLSVNSNAMYNLNYAPNFNRTVVPTHTIGTSFSYTSETNSIIEAVLRSVSIVNGFYAFNDYVNYLFYNEANDGAVKLNSQSGGLSGQYFSTFPNQFHLGANKNVSVMLELENALNFSSINTNYFTLNGLVRTIQESHYRLAMPDTIDNYELIQQGSITINYPLRGQSFSKNTLLSVNISSINGINRVFFAPINSTDKVTYIDTSLNNGDITYQIPNDAFGKITLLVLGYSNNDFISSDTVTININQDASLDSIVIYNSPLYLQELNTEALIIRAYFNDGHNYLMSNQDGLQYYLNDTTIAKYFYGNLIYGKMKGETDLTVIYGDKSLNVPVYVTERDTTIPILNINNIVTAIKNNPVSNIHYLKIYPNPTTGEFALQADIEIGEQVRIEVFNQTGQSVLLNEDKSSSKNYIKNISLSQFSSGVYYIILSTKSANYINKIMLTK